MKAILSFPGHRQSVKNTVYRRNSQARRLQTGDLGADSQWKKWGEAVSTSAADVLPGFQMKSLSETNWYAVFTKTNQEKQVGDRLEHRGIEFYLPLYRTVRKRSDRRVTLSLPLFPGYLFVHIPLTERLRVLEVPGLVRLVGFHSQPMALPQDEIQQLRNGLSGKVHAEPCRYLPTGCRVRVINGPFEGIEAILLRRKPGLRVVISTHVIMRSFSVEVSESDLERI